MASLQLAILTLRTQIHIERICVSKNLMQGEVFLTRTQQNLSAFHGSSVPTQKVKIRACYQSSAVVAATYYHNYCCHDRHYQHPHYSCYYYCIVPNNSISPIYRAVRVIVLLKFSMVSSVSTYEEPFHRPISPE